MEPDLTDALRQAEELIQAGKSDQARLILVDYIRLNPVSEQGWLLLSQVMTEPQRQIDCLRRVLRINPNHVDAQDRLAQLLREASEGKAVPPFTDVEPVLLSEAPEPPVLPVSPVSPVAPEAPTSPSVPAQAPPPVEPTPRPAPPTTEAVRRPPARPRQKLDRRILALGLGLGVLIVVLAILAIIALRDSQEASIYRTQVASLVTHEPRQVLPPTWTHTPVPPATSTPTITPTPPPTLTPTLPAPGPTIAAQMEVIQKQVADLRGLEIQGDVSRYLVTQGTAEQVLTAYLIDPAYEAELRDEAQVLAAFGLIKPTYDLVTYTLNGIVDNIGGVYIPWKKEIFILGLRFSGIEHYVYSHEYDHALVDQHFHIDTMGVFPYCLHNEQRCDAIQALVEGDATLLMTQWWLQYATPQDYRDILNYRPPLLGIPEQFPPPFVSMDVSFPYVYGYEFVKYLHERGNWAGVNQAYSDLPDSTEQIMHPEKYLRQEAPVEVINPSLSDMLSGDWRELRKDVLGEWTTYLILGYGADLEAQQEDLDAATAAAGWGGDAYQAYYSDSTGEILLAAHWVWDSPANAQEFHQLMLDYLDKRFRGNKLYFTAGSCWQASGQTTCLYNKGAGTLWVIAPDEATIAQVVSHYPDFK